MIPLTMSLICLAFANILMPFAVLFQTSVNLNDHALELLIVASLSTLAPFLTKLFKLWFPSTGLKAILIHVVLSIGLGISYSVYFYGIDFLYNLNSVFVILGASNVVYGVLKKSGIVSEL